MSPLRPIPRDPRLPKPGITRTIGDPPPLPDRHTERPHPEPIPQLHTTAVCIHDQVRPVLAHTLPGPSRLTCDPPAQGHEAKGRTATTAHPSVGMYRPARAGLRPPDCSRRSAPGIRLACSPPGPARDLHSGQRHSPSEAGPPRRLAHSVGDGHLAEPSPKPEPRHGHPLQPIGADKPRGTIADHPYPDHRAGAP